MKRTSIIFLLILLCSLPGYSQFWINFGWNEPHCQSCGWMEQAMRLSSGQAADYHKTVHKYGQRIEKEARKHYRYWDQSASAIYKLRMERDRKLQRILSPSQFRLYVRFVRENPKRIHDYQGWYKNPRYPDYRPSDDCRHYEDRYWHLQWEHTNGSWHDRYDDDRRPQHNNQRPSSGRPSRYDKDKKDKDQHNDRDRRSERSRRNDKHRDRDDD